MKKEILTKVLQLDSIFEFLTWKERAYIHQYDRLKIDSKKIITAYNLIIDINWQSPGMRYGQDRLLYYENPYKEFEWILIEEYKKQFPAIEKAVEHLNQK